VELLQPLRPLRAGKAEIRCSICPLHKLCIPQGLEGDDLGRVGDVVSVRRALRRGNVLFRAGDRAGALYAVQSGFFKSTRADGEGNEQVMGFYMGGDILGMEIVGARVHAVTTTALEDSRICTLSHGDIETMEHELPSWQPFFHSLLAREIEREQRAMVLLASARAEERLAAFLLELSHRFVVRGFSATEFRLPMTREDIASYLGLKAETVSRLLTSFERGGVIAVHHKQITILSPLGLRRVRARRARPKDR